MSTAAYYAAQASAAAEEHAAYLAAHGPHHHYTTDAAERLEQAEDAYLTWCDDEGHNPDLPTTVGAWTEHLEGADAGRLNAGHQISTGTPCPAGGGHPGEHPPLPGDTATTERRAA